MTTLFIEDLFGNQIEVTDLDKAIEQTRHDCTSPFRRAPFKIVKGNSEIIKGREHELTTVGAYAKDALDKLYLLKEKRDTGKAQTLCSPPKEIHVNFSN